MRKRSQLFEFADLSIIPNFIRNALTNMLYYYHGIFQSEKIFGPKLAKVIQLTGKKKIQDLCSGGGGPLPRILKVFQKFHDLNVKAMLSDLYPNKTAIDRIKREGNPNVVYLEDPVDATNAPAYNDRVRTLFSSFHHLPPKIARTVLEDAFKKRQPICVFEGTQNSIFNVLLACLIPFTALLCLPMTNPTLKQVIFTYFVPIIPFMYAWDGIASARRTYSPEELGLLVKNLKSDDYEWEIGTIKAPLGMPMKMPYIVGKNKVKKTELK